MLSNTVTEKKSFWSNLRERRTWRLFVISSFILLSILSIFFSLSKGVMDISWSTIWKTFLTSPTDAEQQVLWNIRLPRVIVGALVGINLALAGAILQGVMRNPLADPGIIGISAGAGLTGVIILVLFPQYENLVPIGAFLGAMFAAVMIYILAWKRGIQPIRIILAGVAVSAFLGSWISALMIFYSDRVHGALMFMVGGLSARSWNHVDMIIIYSLIGIALAIIGTRWMNILLLGDETARGLGLNVERTRILMTAVASLLAASAVSVVGLLGFVGLIVPHAARLLIGNDYRFLVPASCFLGIAVVTFSDTIGRLVFAPVEIPVGIIMGVVGAPFFLYLLRRET
ncbi:iron complex transport system permease protein [Evansella vedderi]|uniref:Iron complex transport system permease protein n=1 Tax=Evansella vedderi TaxID=38282 RepID=A0ABT9ZNC5_9BACI|nr:iron ABC transporter permease [Evansella vedderi]MDQ0252735.1 iron complex transport system permease protein [Evansella vedderi]